MATTVFPGETFTHCDVYPKPKPAMDKAELEARQYALQFALQQRYGKESKPEEVVEAAKAFLEFLRGN